MTKMPPPAPGEGYRRGRGGCRLGGVGGQGLDAVGERRPVGGGLVGADEGVGHVDIAGGSGDAGVAERIDVGEGDDPGGVLDDQLRQHRAVAERAGSDVARYARREGD